MAFQHVHHLFFLKWRRILWTILNESFLSNNRYNGMVRLKKHSKPVDLTRAISLRKLNETVLCPPWRTVISSFFSWIKKRYQWIISVTGEPYTLQLSRGVSPFCKRVIEISVDVRKLCSSSKDLTPRLLSQALQSRLLLKLNDSCVKILTIISIPCVTSNILRKECRRALASHTRIFRRKQNWKHSISSLK